MNEYASLQKAILLLLKHLHLSKNVDGVFHSCVRYNAFSLCFINKALEFSMPIYMQDVLFPLSVSVSKEKQMQMF